MAEAIAQTQAAAAPRALDPNQVPVVGQCLFLRAASGKVFVARVTSVAVEGTIARVALAPTGGYERAEA